MTEIRIPQVATSKCFTQIQQRMYSPKTSSLIHLSRGPWGMSSREPASMGTWSISRANSRAFLTLAGRSWLLAEPAGVGLDVAPALAIEL